MTHNAKPTRQSADPHGYVPIIIDEDCLSAEDCREQLMNYLFEIADPSNRHPSWDLKSIMTPQERAVCEKPMERDSEFRVGNYSPKQQDEKCGVAREARLRAYSRDKYAGGQPIWYGDGVPFAMPAAQRR